MVTQAGRDGLGLGHGQLQGVQLIGFPGSLGVCHGLGLFGGVGGFSGWTSWIGGGVVSLAIGTLPVFVATF